MNNSKIVRQTLIGNKYDALSHQFIRADSDIKDTSSPQSSMGVQNDTDLPEFLQDDFKVNLTQLEATPSAISEE